MDAPHTGPLGRRDATTRFGARVMDCVHVHWACPRCARPVADGAVRTVGTVSYRDFDGLLRASNVALAHATISVPRCPGCGDEARLRAADYHAFQSGRRADLVLRWTQSEAPAELWWWDGAGYAPVAPLSELELDDLRIDAVLRAAATRLEAEGVEAALQEIEAARAEVPGELQLLAFVPPLINAGRNGLAGAILDDCVAAHPDSAEAHALHASLTLRLINARLWGAEHLDDAESHLARALELDPTHDAAANDRCLALRMRGRNDAALEGYLALAARRPNNAAILYNIGALSLPGAPAQALEYFARGAARAARDADFPVGEARALLALNRPAEARKALDRARALDPKHPRLVELEAALGRHPQG